MSATNRNPDAVSVIQELYATHGQREYSGEAVTSLAHGLQCARLAETNQAPPALIVAALLHDIGQLIDPDAWDETGNRLMRDLGHEETGARFLSRWFGPEVTEPVRLHVAAKRYLTAVNPDYRAGLSEDSERTLRLQGGPFTEKEADDFLALPYAKDAVALRLWDDAGKIKDAETPDFEYYRPVIYFVYSDVTKR